MLAGDVVDPFITSPGDKIIFSSLKLNVSPAGIGMLFKTQFSGPVAAPLAQKCTSKNVSPSSV